MAWACSGACIPISAGIYLVQSSAGVQISCLNQVGARARVYRASLRYILGKAVFPVIQVCLFSAIQVKAGLQCCAVMQTAHQQLVTPKPASAASFSTLALHHGARVALYCSVAVI